MKVKSPAASAVASRRRGASASPRSPAPTSRSISRRVQLAVMHQGKHERRKNLQETAPPVPQREIRRSRSTAVPAVRLAGVSPAEENGKPERLNQERRKAGKGMDHLEPQKNLRESAQSVDHLCPPRFRNPRSESQRFRLSAFDTPLPRYAPATLRARPSTQRHPCCCVQLLPLAVFSAASNPPPAPPGCPPPRCLARGRGRVQTCCRRG